MYFNFLQNWVSRPRSVKTVHTNICPNNCRLHKFATIPMIFFKSITSDMCEGSGEDILFYFLFIYTVLIERAIHNSMCSNALIHNYKRYTQLYMYIIKKNI